MIIIVIIYFFEDVSLVGVRSNTQRSSTINRGMIRIADIIDFVVFVDIEHRLNIGGIGLEKNTICKTGGSSGGSCILHFVVIATKNHLGVCISLGISFLISL